MKKIFILAVLCLLASASPMSAQLIIRNNGHAEVGHDADDFVAGSSVNNNRTNGFVTVKEGVNYEIEASGNVILEDGFIVKKGASFAVYPSCF